MKEIEQLIEKTITKKGEFANYISPSLSLDTLSPDSSLSTYTDILPSQNS